MPWIRAAGVANPFGVVLDAHLVVGPEDPGDGLTDRDGAWASAFGVGAEGAALVRPDGVVAWRSVGAPQDGTHAEWLLDVLGSLLGRSEVMADAGR
jgi:hypothetical protein